jgi:pimeloyl-ACP methyl ester carboxylesterase
MFLPLGDAAFHVQTEGPPGAEALLLLHSLGTDNLHLWDASRHAAYWRASYRVIRPDLRGHGLSDGDARPL